MQWEDTFINTMDGYIHNQLDLEKLDEQSGQSVVEGEQQVEEGEEGEEGEDGQGEEGHGQR